MTLASPVTKLSPEYDKWMVANHCLSFGRAYIEQVITIPDDDAPADIERWTVVRCGPVSVVNDNGDYRLCIKRPKRLHHENPDYPRAVIEIGLEMPPRNGEVLYEFSLELLDLFWDTVEQTAAVHLHRKRDDGSWMTYSYGEVVM